jgi:hypothetical protein
MANNDLNFQIDSSEEQLINRDSNITKKKIYWNVLKCDIVTTFFLLGISTLGYFFTYVVLVP